MGIMVDAHDVVKEFGSIRALDGLSLAIHEGETYGLIGPNGSGKTTLIRILAGLARATRGKVAVMGRPMPSREVAPHLGYMTQQEALYRDLTVWENLTFFASIYGVTGREQERRIQEVLDLVDLRAQAHSVVETLSGGMKQRVSLACAIVHHPSLLLLDEPTVGIDPELRVSFWQHFRQLNVEGVTIVVSTHYLDEATRCDRVGMMRSGRLLAEDSPARLLARSGKTNLEEAFLWFTSGGAT